MAGHCTLLGEELELFPAKLDATQVHQSPKNFFCVIHAKKW